METAKFIYQIIVDLISGDTRSTNEQYTGYRTVLRRSLCRSFPGVSLLLCLVFTEFSNLPFMALAENDLPSREPLSTQRVSWSMNVEPVIRPVSLRRR